MAGTAKGSWGAAFRRYMRSISHVFNVEAGVSVTVAGSLIGTGAAILGLGIYEDSVGEGDASALENIWVRIGGVTMIAGVALSVAILVVLVVSRARAEEHRKELVLYQQVGSGYLDAMLREEFFMPKGINSWRDRTEALLDRID